MSAARANEAHILIVDDNPAMVFLLSATLQAEGYRVAVARDGVEALDYCAAHRPDLVLLDLSLPRLNGDEVCRRLKSSPATRSIPVVMVTGQNTMQNKVDACGYGADDFLSKPCHQQEVLTRCRSLLRIKRLIEERDSAEAVVFALARTVEAKSPYTLGHSERVMRHSLRLARALRVSDADCEVLHKGALLHDIGKISVPDVILDKPAQLTEEEARIVHLHPEQGVHIIEPLHSLRDTLPLIRWHHERRDGRGYPDGLKGDTIPLLVRILSVADVYDALATERPYRCPIRHEQCLAMLHDNALGGGLDPELVAVFSTITPAALATAEAARQGGVLWSEGRHLDVLKPSQYHHSTSSSSWIAAEH
jgi:putative two-component system response regulator